MIGAGRVYNGTVRKTGVTAATDLCRLLAAATAPIILIRVEVFNETSETDEQAVFEIFRGTGGTAGTGVTPRPLGGVLDSAFAGTLVPLTADATKSPADALYSTAGSTRVGMLWHPIPEERIGIPPSGGLVIRLGSAISSADLRAEIVFAELC